MVNHLSHWQLFGCTVQGAKHIRKNKPNQDAIKWSCEPDLMVMAIADGHGQSQSFRSHIGSVFAVESALDVLSYQFESKEFHGAIIDLWRSKVLNHIQNHAFSLEELTSLDDIESQFVSYGATLILVYSYQDKLVVSQIGDGDILLVSETGVVTRPIKKDERLIANETTSLCQSNAYQLFKQTTLDLQQVNPALIIMATDGYSNSFRSESGFLQVGSDILDMLRVEGSYSVKESLPLWLREASDNGSGDDITLGIISRKDVVNDEIW